MLQIRAIEIIRCSKINCVSKTVAHLDYGIDDICFLFADLVHEMSQEEYERGLQKKLRVQGSQQMQEILIRTVCHRQRRNGAISSVGIPKKIR